MGYKDKLQAKAAEVLQSGESLRAAIRTVPRGTTMGMALGGAVGAVVADRQAKKATGQQTEGSVASGWPAERSAVGLTDQRLLIFNYTFMGKPKDLIGEVSLEDVQSLEVDKGVVNKVKFSFNDGSTTQLEVAKLDKLGDFVSEFEKVRSGAGRLE